VLVVDPQRHWFLKLHNDGNSHQNKYKIGYKQKAGCDHGNHRHGHAEKSKKIWLRVWYDLILMTSNSEPQQAVEKTRHKEG
jgi:hypothetical protein